MIPPGVAKSRKAASRIVSSPSATSPAEPAPAVRASPPSSATPSSMGNSASHTGQPSVPRITQRARVSTAAATSQVDGCDRGQRSASTRSMYMGEGTGCGGPGTTGRELRGGYCGRDLCPVAVDLC
jgi:hypothetical protein